MRSLDSILSYARLRRVPVYTSHAVPYEVWTTRNFIVLVGNQIMTPVDNPVFEYIVSGGHWEDDSDMDMGIAWFDLEQFDTGNTDVNLFNQGDSFE